MPTARLRSNVVWIAYVACLFEVLQQEECTGGQHRTEPSHPDQTIRALLPHQMHLGASKEGRGQSLETNSRTTESRRERHKMNDPSKIRANPQPVSLECDDEVITILQRASARIPNQLRAAGCRKVRRLMKLQKNRGRGGHLRIHGQSARQRLDSKKA